MFRLSAYYLLAVATLALVGGIRSANSQAAAASDDYTTRIQPIFDNRCIACHSCYNAPCQLNLQSHSGLARGATKLNIYDRSRAKSVAPSRLDIDGHSVSDWRAKGFFDVCRRHRACPHAADADGGSEGPASNLAAEKTGQREQFLPGR